MSDLGLLAVVTTVLLLSLACFIMFFFYIFQRRQHQNRQEKAALQAQYEKEILQTQLEIQNQTLQRIGQELHDNIGQLLSVARLHLNMLEIEPTLTGQQVSFANDIVAQSIKELRALNKSLDSDFVKDFGLIESLRHELGRIRQVGKHQTQLNVVGEPHRLDGQKEIVLFRIAQEIMNNIIKHAAAKHIVIAVTYSPTLFRMCVEDDGKGFDTTQLLQRPMTESGAGLRNIKRRTELLGGQCHIESQLTKGTKIDLYVPYSVQLP